MAGLTEMLQAYGALRTLATPRRPVPTGANINDYAVNFMAPGYYEADDVLGADWLDVNIADTSAAQTTLDAALDKITADAALGDGLTTAQKTRFLALLAGVYQQSVPPPPGASLLNQPPPPRPAEESLLSDPNAGQAFLSTLAVLGDDAVPLQARYTRVQAEAPTLLRRVADPEVKLTQRGLAQAAAEAGVLPPDAVDVGECQTKAVPIDGETCVIIDTECRSSIVTLTNLKAVINPFNWAANYNDFFTQMVSFGPYVRDGWTRVLETVSLVGFGIGLVETRLRFHTEEDPKGAWARIDYDLDTLLNPANNCGDGRVRYDRGWVNMWADNPGDNPDLPGIRVRTKKIIRIFEVETWKQELVGFLGYSTMSAEFVLGSAVRPPPDRAPFRDRGPEHEGQAPAAAVQSSTQQSPPAHGRHFAPTAVSIWLDTVEKTMDDCVGVAGKWWSGNLGVDEFADHASRTTDRLIRAPFRFLDAMTSPRIPWTPNQTAQPAQPAQPPPTPAQPNQGQP